MDPCASKGWGRSFGGLDLATLGTSAQTLSRNQVRPPIKLYRTAARFVPDDSLKLRQKPDWRQPVSDKMSRPPLPPFTRESAIEKVRLAEDGWNNRDPAKVCPSPSHSGTPA